MPEKISASLLAAIEATDRNHADKKTFDTLVLLDDASTREYLDRLHEIDERDPDAFFDREAVLANIRRLAACNNRDLLRFLASGSDGPAPAPVRSYWINNAVQARLTRRMIDIVKRRWDVVRLELLDSPDAKAFLPAIASDAKSAGRCDIDAAVPQNASRIGAEALWRRGINGEGVIVAVVDTQVNRSHPDLADRMSPDPGGGAPHGDECACDGNDLSADTYHGTLSAGLIAGDGKSGLKTGLAPGAMMMSVGIGLPETTAWCGYQHALLRGADVVAQSVSWAPDLKKTPHRFHPRYAAWRRACEVIMAARVPHACSIKTSADEARREKSPQAIPFNIPAPANAPPPWRHPAQRLVGGRSSAMACGAADQDGRLIPESGMGPASWSERPFEDYPFDPPSKNGLIKPDVCSYARGACSCSNQFPEKEPAYLPHGGASAATSYLGGCLALLVSACRSARRPVLPSRLQQALEATAAPLVGQKRMKQDQYGAGLINVEAAYDYGRERRWW